VKYDDDWNRKQAIWNRIADGETAKIDTIGYISLGVWDYEELTVDATDLTIADLEAVIAAYRATRTTFDILIAQDWR